MKAQTIIQKFTEWADDPLSRIIITEIPYREWVIRWLGGFVQWRRRTAPNFSLPISAEELIAMLDVPRPAPELDDEDRAIEQAAIDDYLAFEDQD